MTVVYDCTRCKFKWILLIKKIFQQCGTRQPQTPLDTRHNPSHNSHICTLITHPVDPQNHGISRHRSLFSFPLTVSPSLAKYYRAVAAQEFLCYPPLWPCFRFCAYCIAPTDSLVSNIALPLLDSFLFSRYWRRWGRQDPSTELLLNERDLSAVHLYHWFDALKKLPRPVVSQGVSSRIFNLRRFPGRLVSNFQPPVVHCPGGPSLA
jgi:hypothetical protein